MAGLVTDVYSRKVQYGGSFSADSVTMTFTADGGAVGGVGNLVQNLQMSYSQSITRLYEVGSPNTYFIAGRAQGQGMLGRIIGPKILSANFYRKYGNVCNVDDNILRFKGAFGCGSKVTNQSGEIIASFVVLNNIALQVNAEQVVITENVGFMFAAMEYNAIA
jgi:hypothetical protein